MASMQDIQNASWGNAPDQGSWFQTNAPTGYQQFGANEQRAPLASAGYDPTKDPNNALYGAISEMPPGGWGNAGGGYQDIDLNAPSMIPGAGQKINPDGSLTTWGDLTPPRQAAPPGTYDPKTGKVVGGAGGGTSYLGGSPTFNEQGPAGPTINPTGSVGQGGGGGDVVAAIRQWQSTHPAAGGAGLDQMVNDLKAQGFDVSRFSYNGTPSNNELDIPGYGKYKVFSEGNNQWYYGGDDSGGGGGMDWGAAGSAMAPWTKEFVPPTGATEENDPGYAFRLGEGQKAIERAAAAKGNLLTGATMKGLQRWSQDYASNEYNNVYNRALGQYGLARENFYANQDRPWAKQMGLASLGAGAAGSLGNVGAAYGRSGSDLYTGIGNAGGAGTIGAANAWTNALGGISNTVQGSGGSGTGQSGTTPLAGAGTYQPSPYVMNQDYTH